MGRFLIGTKRFFSHSPKSSFSPVDAKNLPKVQNDEDAVYFLHIPKTAGTSVLTILDDKFDYESICDRHDWGELINDIPKNFSTCKLFRGHFLYGFYHQFSKKPLFLTMLRDPEKQIPSQYEQSRRNYKRRFGKDPPKDSLLDYLNHPKRSLVARNNQTRHVAVDFDVISHIKNMDEETFGNFFRFNDPIFKQPKLKPAKLLEQAKKHLEEFAFVGITEKFEESMQLLCYTFGWKPIREIPKVNVNPNETTKKREFSTNELEAIKKVTPLDRQLYSFTCSLFEKKYENMIQSLKEKYFEQNMDSLPKNELVYDLLEKHYEQVFWKKTPKLEKIDYNFSQSLVGSGWHPREKAPITGNFFRWTGPSTISIIDLPLKTENDLIVKFRISMALTPDMLDSLQFFVNNSHIDIKKTSQFDKKTICESKIPKSTLQSKNDFVRFSFKINKTISPHELDSASDDYRKLGLAFDWIKIHPKNSEHF